MAEPPEQPIEFCTLGMFIIDEIHFKPPIPPVKDILGGAGSYSALGARLFSPPPLSSRVGWIVDCGSDFPQELRDAVAAWETSCLMRETPERLTTRGWNGYGENEHRAFRYTTPKLRLDHNALSDDLLRSKSFHLICSPTRCIDLVTDIMRRRKESSLEKLGRPIFIWEPVPDLCTQEEFSNCLAALKHVDVLSPNHLELGGFFGQRPVLSNGHVDTRWVQDMSNLLIRSGIRDDHLGVIAVRCGADGCYVANRGDNFWMPAYHQNPKKVVDPTGGGNAFLGGFAIGLARHGVEWTMYDHLHHGAIFGTVAASFAIEQVGMPSLAQEPHGETWNGVHVRDRVDEFCKRIGWRYVQL